MLISVDPGVGGTGVARWLDSGKLFDTHTLHASKEGEWLYRAFAIVRAFEIILESPAFEINEVVLEGPVFMGGAGGHTVAASGDLCKLAMLAGMLARAAHREHPAANILLAAPADWKGQVSKEAAARRIRKIMGADFPNGRISNHAIDAVGIGLWRQGKF